MGFVGAALKFGMILNADVKIAVGQLYCLDKSAVRGKSRQR